MKIGYFGDGVWAHCALKKILDDQSMTVAFVCGRSYAPDPALERMAMKASIPFITHHNVNSPDFLGQISAFSCDIFVSMSFNQIFHDKILNTPPLHVINCHAGKLPFYRGRNILNWALINDEKEFGITVHYVDRGIDTGDIIVQESYPITDSDTYKTLLEKAQSACPDLLYSSLKQIAAKQVHLVKQQDIDPVGSYCKKRSAGDEVLNWDQNSRAVFNFIRALCKPGPMALSYAGGEKVYINTAEVIPNSAPQAGVPGAVLEVGTDYLVVKTSDTSIKILEWDCMRHIKTGEQLKVKPS